MGEPGREHPTEDLGREYRLIQQELVEARYRLDQQVRQLKRLNAIARPIQRAGRPVSLIESFAEHVLDVLDVGFGAAWIVPLTGTAGRTVFAAVGSPVPHDRWRDAGPDVLERIRGAADSGAVWAPADLMTLLPDVELHNPLAVVVRTREGDHEIVLLGGETTRTSGLTAALSEESLEVLTLLAEKCADHLDATTDWDTIEQQMDRLQESEERLDLVLRGTNDGWWDWDLRSGRCIVSARWLEMLGYDPVSVLRDEFWHEDIHDEDRLTFGWNLERALTGEIPAVEAEVQLRRRDGSYLPVLVRGTVSRDQSGTPIRFAGSILDLSERKRYEAHVHQLAFYDVLTELPNRRLLLDRLGQLLLAQGRSAQLSAVVMLDLDRFKVINDTQGHAAGDALLRAVAARLRATVRSHDTVARLGGDEFVVLLEDLGADQSEALPLAQRLAHKILDALNEPFVLESGLTHHSASIGVALTGDGDVSADTFLKRADVALYEAKASGRNAVRMFHPEMQSRVDERSEMESHLRDAIASRQLRLSYQPQVFLDGSLYGAEALMRWRTDDGTTVPPSVFIPVAEESGQIHALGAWGLEEACRQVALWKPFAPPGFRVAVNVSAPEFLQQDFVSRVLSTIESAGVSGKDLRLEITEANVVADLEYAAARMDQMRSQGLEFSLDDFGTGYSSLTYLRRLPVSEVKIDRSYVGRFMNNRQDAAIMRAIFALCSSLDIDVVAEGVETESQRQLLGEFGCRVFQGYLFGAAGTAGTDPRDLLNQQAPMLPRHRPVPRQRSAG